MDQNNHEKDCLTVLTPEDLNKICRSCLSNIGLINLFKTEYNGLLLCDLLTAFCKVEAEEFDGFPQNICSNCVDFIIQCYHFRETVQQSHSTLEEALEKEKSYAKMKIAEESKEESMNEIEEDTVDIKESVSSDECPTSDSSEMSKFETTETKTENDDDNTLTCSFCKITFTSESIFAMHMDMELQLRKEEKCKVCDQLVSKPKLRGHIQEHAKNNDIVCKICNRSFAHPWHLVKHHQTHLKKMKEQCHICGLTLSKINIEDHIRDHLGEKNISCDICDEKFITTRALRRHKFEHRVATGEVQHKVCKVCGKTVKGRLSAHMQKHRFKTLCSECGKEFTYRNNLSRHILSVHRKLKPYKCQICHASFSQKTTLKCHLSVHSGERPYLCSECGKTFKAKIHLKVHIKNKHTLDSDGTKKRKIVPEGVTCEYCGKNFDYPHRLRLHMQQHSNKKPYSCHLCHKTFKQNSSLQVHLQYHKDSQLFCCDLCPKAFISLVALKLHRAKMHTHRSKNTFKEKIGADKDVEKPYGCRSCSRKFMYKWNLKKHVKFHEKENKFSCDVCFKIFSDSEKVEEHKSEEHEELIEDFSETSN